MSRYTWPDGTPKSQSNAFEWRGRPSMFAKAPAHERSLQIPSTLKAKAFYVCGQAKTKGQA